MTTTDRAPNFATLCRAIAAFPQVALIGLAIVGLPSSVAAQSASGYYLGAAANDPNQQNNQQNQSNNNANNNNGNNSTTPTSQIIQPVGINSTTTTPEDQNKNSQLQHDQQGGTSQSNDLRLFPKPPAKPGEFETWANQVSGRKLKRFGTDLLLPASRDFAVPAASTIPPDYALNIGDTVSVSLTGSVEGSANFEINRDGQIYLPNVGSVSVAGVRYRDLKDRISQAIGRKYRGYDVSVSVASLRGIRVYVTGFANQPGAYTVNSLSTLLNAVFAAGGPASGGSFRHVKLYRNGREVTDFDLYKILRHGDRSHDPLLQNEDVLFIPPVGEQVAVVGSVNEEAIYEALPGETIEEMLRVAGGPTNLADPSRVILYSLADRETVGSRQIDHAQFASIPASAGDIVQVLTQGSLARPLERQQVIVRIEGEVAHPGNYYVAPGTPLSEIVSKAGGLTPRAYVFGSTLYRDSVRQQQRQSFMQVVDQMETALAVAPINGDRIVDATERQGQIDAARTFIAKIRTKEPDGRLVLDLQPDAQRLPDNLVMDNNDRLLVPPIVNTVGVFGAVYRPASFLLDGSKRTKLKDYIEEAGGGIRGADLGHSFVVRANGSVITSHHGGLQRTALAGDTIYVPIKTQSSSILSKIRDISSVIFQLGLGAAAVAAIR